MPEIFSILANPIKRLELFIKHDITNMICEYKNESVCGKVAIILFSAYIRISFYTVV